MLTEILVLNKNKILYYIKIEVIYELNMKIILNW